MTDYRFDEKTEQFLEGLGLSNVCRNEDGEKDPSIRKDQYSESALELYVYAENIDDKPAYHFQVGICGKSLNKLNKSISRCKKLAKQIDDYFKTHDFSVRPIENPED